MQHSAGFIVWVHRRVEHQAAISSKHVKSSSGKFIQCSLRTVTVSSTLRTRLWPSSRRSSPPPCTAPRRLRSICTYHNGIQSIMEQYRVPAA